jgi:DNA-binding NarL/FixJ family response regulator
MTSKIIVADDHPLFRQAMKQVIPQAINGCTMLEADSFFTLKEQLENNDDIDLLLLDLHMPGNKGFVALNTIRTEFPSIPIVIVSASDSAKIIRRSYAFGASGYITKSSSFDTIKQALKCVMEGEIWVDEEVKSDLALAGSDDECFASKIASLTLQQFKVLSMIANGQLNKQIAYELSIQETTVKHHVSSILRKLKVINRTGAGIMFNQLQIEDGSKQEY